MKKYIYTASIILLTAITVFTLLIGLFPEFLFLLTLFPVSVDNYATLGAFFSNLWLLPGSLMCILCAILYVPSFIMYRISCVHYNAQNYKTANRYGIAQTVFYFLCTVIMAFLSLFWLLQAFMTFIDGTHIISDFFELPLDWFVYLCTLFFFFGTLVFFVAGIGNIIFLRHKSKEMMIIND